MKKILSIKNILALLIVLASILSHRVWLFSLGILTKGDWPFYNVDTLNTARYESLFSWYPNFTFGDTILSFCQTPIITLAGILSKHLHFEYGLIERLLFLWPLFVFSLVGIFLLLNKLLRSKVAIFVSIIIFCFNTYFLVLQTGHITLMAAYSFGPLILWSYMRVLERKSIAWAVFTALAMTVSSIYDFRALLIICVLLFCYAIYNSLFLYSTKKNNIFRNILFAILPFFVFALLNTYWIIGLARTGLLNDNSLFNRGLFGNEFMSLERALTLFHPFWTGSALKIFVAQDVPIYFWVIPLLVSITLLIKKRDKNVLFFAFIALLGIFLVKQVDEPFSQVYPWLFENVPGFNAYREASKFYFLIVISYTVIIGYFIEWLMAIRQKKKYVKFLRNTFIILIALVFLWNIKPFLTGEIGTLFSTRKIPEDYLKLNEFMRNQSGYYRTYWVPTDSRWGYFTNQNPIVSDYEALSDKWRQYVDITKDINIQERLMSIFTQSYSNDLFDNSSIKYVIIPLQDQANDDDFYINFGERENPKIRQWYQDELDKISWLKKIDIGTKELIIYENKGYAPHVSAKSAVYRLETFNDLANQVNFLHRIGVSGVNYYTDKQFVSGSSGIKSIFNKPIITAQNGQSNIKDTIEYNAGNVIFYKNTTKSNLIYKATNDRVDIYSQTLDNPNLNGNIIDIAAENTESYINSFTFKSGSEPFLLLDNQLMAVITNKTLNLGDLNQYDTISLINNIAGNQITNGSFETGLWQTKVADCNAYDTNGILGMRLSDQHTEGKQSLALEATKHIACTSMGFKIKDGSSILSFSYKGTTKSVAGYSITFNDIDKTTIKDKLIISGSDWQKRHKFIKVPNGTTNATIYLYSYATDGKTSNIVLYDDVALRRVDITNITKLPRYQDTFLGASLTLKDKNEIALKYSDNNTKNLVLEPSFETGLWQTKVADCNAYDTNGILGMRLSDQHTEGKQSLALEATKHIACTNTTLALTNVGDYSFSFDYHSPNAKKAGYHLRFNDKNNTVIKETLTIDNTNWHNFSKVVNVPNGASTATLYLYAYESDGRTSNIVLYDNVKFIKIPELSNAYYLLTESATKLVAPKKLAFGAINPTKQAVQISGATKSFLLSFAESYNIGWHLYLQPITDTVPCAPLKSFGLPEAQVVECRQITSFGEVEDVGRLAKNPVFEDSHIKLNGYANGWIIDPDYLKSSLPKDYWRQNADGSIDLNVVIYFKPQSYFYIGSVISGIIFLGCIGYLIFRFKFKKNVYIDSRLKSQLIKGKKL